jgi:Stage II sporulation protein E (SpoIIE)
MSVSERRMARRFILNVPLQLLPIKASSQAAWAVETMNISTRGVYFTTDLPLCQGQLVQVLLQMPKEITGNVVNARRFTGRVAHVDPNGFANGLSGVGVQFLYYGELALQLHEQEQENSEARSIQQGLLPKEIPQFPGYEIASAWQSARVVGGDYFDVLPFDADSLGLCIADVAGKGFSAALLMSNLQAAVRGLAAPSLPPNELCLRLNALLHRNMEGIASLRFSTPSWTAPPAG